MNNLKFTYLEFRYEGMFFESWVKTALSKPGEGLFKDRQVPKGLQDHRNKTVILIFLINYSKVSEKLSRGGSLKCAYNTFGFPIICVNLAFNYIGFTVDCGPPALDTLPTAPKTGYLGYFEHIFRCSSYCLML
jgi:hypothetical protein